MLPNADLDLRKEHELLQNEFSIDILYIRATKYIRCKCFNMLHQTGDPNCHICFGNGHLTTIEKTRAITHGIQTQRPNTGFTMTELGMASAPALEFYMEYDKMPKVRDMIVVTGWDKKGEPQDVKKVCVITSVDEVRGESGRVELYACNSTVKPELHKPVQKVISRLDSQARTAIASRRRYIWPLQK